MLTQKEFIEAYDRIGRGKVDAPLWKLLLLGALAGFLIGCGALISSIASLGVSVAGLGKAVAGLLFPLGLIMVILSGAELFTGNCLLMSPLLRRKITAAECLRNLVPVYIGNCAGSVLFAAACVYSGVYAFGGGALAESAAAVAASKMALPFGVAFVKGTLCNILVCAAVMFAISAKSVPGKALGAFVPVAVFVIAGFEHSIANAYYLPLGMMLDPSLTLGGCVGNLIPVTLGNLVGGFGFAAVMSASHG